MRSAENSPIFCVGGLGGASLYLRDLAEAFGASQPFIALQPPGLFAGEVPLGSVEELGGLFVEEVLRLQSRGAYRLAGHSFGGVVALEMARQLVARGCDVAHVFLLDTVRIEEDGAIQDNANSQKKATYEVRNVVRRLAGQSRDKQGCELFVAADEGTQMADLQATLDATSIVPASTSLSRIIEVYRLNFSAMLAYRPSYYRGKVTLFRAREPFPQESLHPERTVRARFFDEDLGWRLHCMILDVIVVPGDHFSLVLGDNAEVLARVMLAVSHGCGVERLATSSREPVPSSGRVLEIGNGQVIFDPFHPMMRTNPYPILRQMTEHSPVHRDPTGTWWVFRYADVSERLRDKRLSADLRSLPDPGRPLVNVGHDGLKPSLASAWIRRQEDVPLARLYNNTMLFVENPQHARLRKAFSPIFSPEVMARWERSVASRVGRLVEEMSTKDRPDIIRDLALPLPVGVVMDILDIPHHDGELIRDLARDIFVGLDPLLPASRTHQIVSAEGKLRTYVADHLHRWDAGNDGSFMGCLAELQSKGELSLDEVVSNCVFFFAAAFETATGAIGNAVDALFNHPEQWMVLKSQPALIYGAVDEFLRYDAPVRVVARAALEDIAIDGSEIPKGSMVMLCLSSANRDADVFPNPDVLDVRRDARKQVAFSHGAHYCIGAPLARIEIACALAALVKLDMKPVPGGAVRRDSKVFRGFDKLEVELG